MHACGHDGHVAIGLGVATLLARYRDEFGGTVKLMFQPGEEGMNGAELMIADGVLDRIGPRPDIALAAHVWNDKPFGKVGVVAGPILAAAEAWECVIRGIGGHGAAPHQTADPIVAAAQVILAWQTAISRNVDPLETAVLSVGAIHSGEAFNIIPNTVTLRGTIRTFDGDVRETVLRRLEEIASGVSAALGCTAEIDLKPLTPALVNDPEVTALTREVVARIVGEENIFESRTMGSEDMAFINALIPGCYIMVGSKNEEAGLIHPHHNPRFDFDEDVLPLAVGLMTTAAIEYLNR
jgi:amidohydrolase